MNQPLSNAQTRDVEALLHPYTNAVALRETGPMVIKRGEGVRVYDSAGKPLHRGDGGALVRVARLRQCRLVEAARAADGEAALLSHLRRQGHEPAVELAEKLKAMAPGRMARCVRQLSGSEANDTQVKLAWYYNNALGRPRRRRSSRGSKAYHGVTIVGGVADRARRQPPRLRPAASPGMLHHRRAAFLAGAEPGESEEAFAARLAGELEALIEREGPDTIAAFIAEPVMGAGGVIVPPAGYFDAIAADLPQARHPVDLRRGDLRLRPHRQMVRRADASTLRPTSCRWPSS